MRKPSTAGLAVEQRDAASELARTLAGAGVRAWIVGGAVRDLALGLRPKDLDMVSAARPEEIVRLLPGAKEVGRAFGVMLVRRRDMVIELATFRTDGEYRDARRPEEVHFSTSVEDDALRRDFTCNALYLDPLSDELLDPTGGLADLSQRTLRAVGDATGRFSEDGLRLMRLARLAAAHGLSPAPGLLDAALSCSTALRGVSDERRGSELNTMLAGPAACRALGLLGRIGLTETLFPWQTADQGLRHLQALLLPLEASPDAGPASTAGLGGGEALLARWCAVLGWPGADDPAELEGRARRFRLSRSVTRDLRRTAALTRSVPPLLAGSPARSERILALREDPWRPALALLISAARRSGESAVEGLEELRSWRATLRAEDLRPQPLLLAEDLLERGVPRTAALGSLLDAAQAAQLDGVLTSRDQALRWLNGQLEQGPGA